MHHSSSCIHSSVLHSLLCPNNVPLYILLRFTCPLICWGAFELFPPSSYYEWGSYEHSRTYFCMDKCCHFLVYIPWMELLDHMVTLGLTFWGTARLFPKPAPLHSPTGSVYGLSFSTSSPPLAVIFLFYFSHLRGSTSLEVVLLCIP